MAMIYESILLAGRVLLIFLFLGFILEGEWSPARLVMSIFGLTASAMIIIGFKAQWSAAFLGIFLSIFNVIVNSFWTFPSADYRQDFLR
jgi:ER-derived vesicles protein